MARVTPNIVVRAVAECGERRGRQVQRRVLRGNVAGKMGHRRGGETIGLGHRGERGAVGWSVRRRVGIERGVRGQGRCMGHMSGGAIGQGGVWQMWSINRGRSLRGNEGGLVHGLWILKMGMWIMMRRFLV